MSIVSVAAAAILVAGSQVNNQASNKIDAVDRARITIENVSAIVRQGKNLGDLTVPGAAAANTFPVAGNVVYGSAPAGGWPTAPWTGQPYTLSPQTLIVQVPVFDANGYPTGLPAVSGVIPFNVNTYVYKVLPDPNASGTFRLQVAMFPGQASTTPAINPPRTLISGIIGPIDPANNGQCKIFHYIDGTDATRAAQDAPTGATIANFTGVRIELELRSSTFSIRNPSTVPIGTTIFLRNNNAAS